MKVLVVAAHPDYEVLGCGGTIARDADAGDQVQVLIVAEGATLRLLKRDRLQADEEAIHLGSIGSESWIDSRCSRC